MNGSRTINSQDVQALADQLQRARFTYDRSPTDQNYIHLLEIERMVRDRESKAKDQEIYALRRKLSGRPMVGAR